MRPVAPCAILLPGMETRRVSLEPLTLDDAPAPSEALADPTLYVHIGGEPPSIEDLRATIGHYLDGPGEPGEAWHNWAIRRADGPDPGMIVGQLQATVRDHGRSAEIAWIVGSRWHGRGYATDAAQWLVDWLAVSGAGEALAHVAPANVASARVAAKAGLEPTGQVDDGEVLWRRSLGAVAGETGSTPTP